MRKEILSERPNLFEPDAYIGYVFELTGNISYEQMKNSVLTAYHANETTMSRIVLTEDGHAYYEKMSETGCTVEPAYDKFDKIFIDNKKNPFRLNEGELIRTFIISEDLKMTVLIIAHHLAGDGKAVARFAKEILEILDGKEVPYTPIYILSKEDFNQRGALLGIFKLLCKHVNSKWSRVGKAFTWDDYERIHRTYWKNHSEYIQCNWMNEEAFLQMKENTKRAGVTVNSWLISKIQRRYLQTKIIGIPVSVRDSNTSMNNMTTGITIHHTYNKNKSLEYNARQIHKKIRTVLSNCHKKYLAISFMAEVSGSMIDGVLMQEHHLYDNPLTRKMCRIIGYSGKRKTQLGISNLGIIDLPISHKDYSVQKVLFIPPRVSYTEKVIGIATYRNQVCIIENVIK